MLLPTNSEQKNKVTKISKISEFSYLAYGQIRKLWENFSKLQLWQKFAEF